MHEFRIRLLQALSAALRSRADLVAENLLLRRQLAVLARPSRNRPPLRGRDKLLWVLARRVCAAWRHHLVLVRPDTVVRWNHRAWKLWRGKIPAASIRTVAFDFSRRACCSGRLSSWC